MSRTILGVRTDRILSAAAIALSASFLLCGYEFIRSPSNSLFVKAYGAENLPIVMALGPIGLIVMIYGYGLLLSRRGARQAMILTSVGSAGIILLCYGGIRYGFKPATGVLYVFREAYIVILVEQIWAFINSTVRMEEGRRLNGPICGVASIGAIAGGMLVHILAKKAGSNNLLILAAASLAPTCLLAILAYRWGGEPAPSVEEAGGKRGHLGAGVFFGNRMLGTLALLIVATQVVSTLLDLQFNRALESAIPDMDARTKWSGGFFAALNVAAFVLQFVGAPFLVRFVPPMLLQCAIPFANALACVVSLAHPSLATAVGPYYVFKALDYSVFRASKELLYIPLSFDARYRAKELVDAFAYRFGKGGTGLVLALAGTPQLAQAASSAARRFLVSICGEKGPSAAAAVANRLVSMGTATYSMAALSVLFGWLAVVVSLASAWRSQSRSQDQSIGAGAISKT